MTTSPGWVVVDSLQKASLASYSTWTKLAESGVEIEEKMLAVVLAPRERQVPLVVAVVACCHQRRKDQKLPKQPCRPPKSTHFHRARHSHRHRFQREHLVATMPEEGHPALAEDLQELVDAVPEVAVEDIGTTSSSFYYPPIMPTNINSFCLGTNTEK